jgi:hypothetical protein
MSLNNMALNNLKAPHQESDTGPSGVCVARVFFAEPQALLRARVRALRRFKARRSSSLIPPHTPAS